MDLPDNAHPPAVARRRLGGQLAVKHPGAAIVLDRLPTTTYRTRLVVGQRSGRIVHSRLGNGFRCAKGMLLGSVCEEMHTSVSRLSNNLRRGRVESDTRGG